jgi:hypothetical protein
MTLCGVVALGFLGGCASTGGAAASPAAAKGGGSDNADIKAMLVTWKAGMESKDVAKIEGGISEEFKHYEWGDKKGFIGFLKQTFDQGDLDGAKVNADAAKVTVDKAKGTATVYPVELSASFGSATIEFNLKKEADGKWRAIGLTVEGV